jgi:SAM-dependent methyltransferase
MGKVGRLYKGVPLRDSMLNKGIAHHLKPGCRILDAGCGHDAPITTLHAPEAELAVGVDLVEEFDTVEGVELIRADLNQLPFAPDSFDLIFSRSVLEHLLEPHLTFMEFSRVLKPEGTMILVTPNKYDYASLFARLIPNRMHGIFLKSTAGDDVYDNFPTYFRSNNRRAIDRILARTDLKLKKFTYIRHYPYYLMFSLPLFYLGVAYDRLITKLNLGFLQPTIYMELVKK